MPTALIYDQNPALQAQAAHALKLNGFDPITRSGGPLKEILEELNPELVITSAQYQSILRRLLLNFPFLTVLISEELETKTKLPFSALLQRPFKTELLTEVIARLKSLRQTPLAGHVCLNLKDSSLSQLLELALRARAISVSNGATLFYITDTPTDQHFGEQLIIQDFSRPLSDTLLKYLETELELPSPAKVPMPMTEAEEQLLRRTILKSVERTLSESKAFRHRQWQTVIEELNLVFTELFGK